MDMLDRNAKIYRNIFLLIGLLLAIYLVIRLTS